MGFRVPPNALMPLVNGELAYIVRRFDRTQGGKIPLKDMVPDFTQVDPPDFIKLTPLISRN
jgi:hypothetical protein